MRPAFKTNQGLAATSLAAGIVLEFGRTLLNQNAIATTDVSQHMKKQALAPDSLLQSPPGIPVTA